MIVPPDGYLKAVRDLCSKYNVLMIADEIQSGLGRSGRLLACDWDEVHPDVVVRIISNIYFRIFSNCLSTKISISLYDFKFPCFGFCMCLKDPDMINL